MTKPQGSAGLFRWKCRRQEAGIHSGGAHAQTCQLKGQMDEKSKFDGLIYP